jgi:uncharacterized protein
MPQVTSTFFVLPSSLQNLIQFLIASKNIQKIILFGSRARNQARDNSDYDFALWVADRSVWTKTLSELQEKTLTLLPIDLALYDELSPEYQSNIDREGLIIYG